MQLPPLTLLLASLHLANSALLPTHLDHLTLPPTTNTSLPLYNQTSELFERIDYLVPTTSTYISVLLFTKYPLAPMEAEIVLSAIDHQLTTHISQHGDGPLSNADDPYEFGIPGCHCSTSSASEDSLTYGVLRDTMKGLQHVVVGGRRFYKAFFDISEGDAGGRNLGEGNLEEKGHDLVAHFV